MANPSDFVSRYRGAVTAWLVAMEDLAGLRAQYDALDYGSTLPPEAFEGANSDITKENLVAAVGSIEAIDGFTNAGHYTNLYALKV